MTKETDDLLTDMRAVAGEVFPYRDPEAFNPPDYLLVLGVTLRREMEPVRDRVESLERELAPLRQRTAPPPTTREEQLGVSRMPEDCS